MQPFARTTLRTALRFQSSSGQKAGCNRSLLPASSIPSCFNPHPARRPDATAETLWSINATMFGFQSSSGQKAGCNST